MTRLREILGGFGGFVALLLRQGKCKGTATSVTASNRMEWYGAKNAYIHEKIKMIMIMIIQYNTEYIRIGITQINLTVSLNEYR